jgi:PAS domain S-box-containing protein
VSLTISPIRDSTGRIIAVSKIARDITARVRAEHRLAMQDGVTRTLAESAGLHEAAPRILRAICEHLDWQVGALWYVDEQVLRCAEVYHSPQGDAPRFEADSRERVLERGIGLPGRVWATGEAVSIRDVVEDDSFLRAAMAEVEGLHGAVGFPITLNEEVMGVMEFFSHEARQPDEDMLQMMTAIGSQIGQFIERRRAEEALRDSEMRFRLMAASVPSIIWTAAPDGTMTYANERWFEYCGLTPDQNGRGWLAVLHPDDEQRCVAAWTAALQQGVPFEIEVRHRRHDGVYRWFVTRAVPFRDARDRVVQWFGTTTDIDDRKRTEQTTRFLADASAALTTITDYESTLQAVVARAVPDFADWCVVDIREADGSVRRLGVAHVDPTKVQLINELDRKQSRESQGRGVRNVIRTGELEWAAEISDDMPVALTQGDDHLRIMRELGVKSYISVPLKSRAHVLGALTFVTAESGRAYGEDDVRAAEDLAHRAVIAIENSGLLSTLQEADRRKDEFLAMLAHELRNPLAPIRNAEQIIRAKGPPVPELQWATGVIDRQVHQMTRLVDDLLDVSRITRGKIELRKEFVDLATIVDTAVEASRPLIEKWGHQLTVTIPSSPIRLEADPPRISQVLSNVLNNAAKYTRHDGRIALTVELQGDHVLIRISDNGIGISAQALPRIFDMFTQEDRSLERAEGGLGIGLTLVKRLVEMHGGTVDARSEGLGKGSEFVVRLPVAIDVEARSPQRPADGQEAIAPLARRILIVDDNYDAADTLGILLGTTGNEVQTAHDGLEAVKKAAAFRPDVVLLDIGLPKLNGYEAARRIRQQEGGADIMLVALTGWGQAEDRRRSAEAGFDHHMTKPVEFNALQKLLAEAQPQR